MKGEKLSAICGGISAAFFWHVGWHEVIVFFVVAFMFIVAYRQMHQMGLHTTEESNQKEI